jgi:hypothetical protein
MTPLSRSGEVRYGSFASIFASPGKVCFTPDNDQKADVLGCPQSANSGHRSERETGAATETNDQWAKATRRSRPPQGCLPGQRAVRPLGQIICQVFFNLAFAWIRSNVSNPSLKEP